MKISRNIKFAILISNMYAYIHDLRCTNVGSVCEIRIREICACKCYFIITPLRNEVIQWTTQNRRSLNFHNCAAIAMVLTHQRRDFFNDALFSVIYIDHNNFNTVLILCRIIFLSYLENSFFLETKQYGFREKVWILFALFFIHSTIWDTLDFY